MSIVYNCQLNVSIQSKSYDFFLNNFSKLLYIVYQRLSTSFASGLCDILIKFRFILCILISQILHASCCC